MSFHKIAQFMSDETLPLITSKLSKSRVTPMIKVVQVQYNPTIEVELCVQDRGRMEQVLKHGDYTIIEKETFNSPKSKSEKTYKMYHTFERETVREFSLWV